ncbi:hypothetical protein HMN09_01120500 [Mycena chlorophos]|uniref:Expansin family protein n=1 Tax=Mycena chlorophos TaxID=658473 RepID=A0A8H6SB85_MYCCL|nr:hypothetical protein HMN09_01120500 [Mycena chlorophos]
MLPLITTLIPFVALALLPVAHTENVVLMTNYYVNSGEVACGGYYSDSDYVVAISAQNFGNGEYCGKEISIWHDGLSTSAKIVDECMGCPNWGLDLSQDLFGYFVGGAQNDNNVGTMTATWDFAGAAATPTHTTSTHTTPTTTSTTHTTTHSTTTTTATTHSSSASSTHSSSAFSSAKSSASASASSVAAAATPTGAQNLQDFTDSLVNLLGLVAQAPEAK